MTEPVAYMWKTERGTIIGFTPNDNSHSGGQLWIPLYTADQLQPRVKMTKKQHKQFENYKTNKNDFYNFWQSLLVDDVSLFKEISERNLMLAWLDDRTIEIVPDMKWFVRSKTSDEKYGYWYLHKTEHYFFHEYIKELSTQFDTKEEADLWTNPLTEAVQLPVEGENDI